jgi:hypothetical protein
MLQQSSTALCISAIAAAAAAVSGALFLLRSTLGPADGKSSSSARSSSGKTVCTPCDVPEGFVKLQPSPGEHDVFSKFGATGTVSFYKGSFSDAQEYLKERFSEVLKKNPWLAGRLKTDMGTPIIVHPSTLLDEHMQQLWLVDTDVDYLSPKMPFADLCRKVVIPVDCCQRMFESVIVLWRGLLYTAFCASATSRFFVCDGVFAV